jgi:hypothetical protein
MPIMSCQEENDRTMMNSSVLITAILNVFGEEFSPEK